MNVRSNKIAYVVIFLCGFLMLGYSAWMLLGFAQDNLSASAEYDYLRESTGFVGQPTSTEEAASLPIGYARIDLFDTYTYVSDATKPYGSPHNFARLFEINPDFIGWIDVQNTGISYPVVQGNDNDFYLTHTFMHAQNPSGAIFLDYRAVLGFDTPISIIYGHNMRDGSMFAPLFGVSADSDTKITITTPYETIAYNVFEVRRTDMWDCVYQLDFSDPKSAEFFGRGCAIRQRFLVLSTCIGHTGSDARLIIIAQEVGG